MITVLDPLRPGDELTYHPGETCLRLADVIVINKVDMASASAIELVRANARAANPRARIVHTASPVSIDEGPSLAGARVVIVEDGPTLTHGGMAYGAGAIAADQAGAVPVDPRPYAVGLLAEALAANPAIAAALAGALPTGGASAAAADGASSPPPSTTPWRPRGVPLAHLAEHSRGVAGLAVARGGRFFVSASSDGTARVWDVAGLERDVSQRSRGVYGGGGGSSGSSSPLTAVAACADGDTVATGGADGAIHVWRASYARGSGGGASAGRPQGPERVAGLAAVAVGGVVAWQLLARSSAETPPEDK
jgi:hypothetical protein